MMFYTAQGFRFSLNPCTAKRCENFSGFLGITYDMAVLRASSQSDTSFLLSE